MKTCSVKTLESLRWCTGSPSYAGIRRRVYFTSKSAVADDGWGSREGTVKNGTAPTPVLATDQKWHFIDIVAESSSLKSEIQGEAPSQTYKNTLVAVHAGVDVDAAKVAAQVANDDVVALVQDGAGKWRMIGSPDFPTIVTVAQDNGEGVTGKTSTTFTFEATDYAPAPFVEDFDLTNEKNRDDYVAPATSGSEG